jgi:hypothetical protein
MPFQYLPHVFTFSFIFALVLKAGQMTNVFESRSGEVYSIQHYVITSEQYNSVTESETNIVICVQ